MTTDTTEFTEQDIYRLRDLMLDLHDAGRDEDAHLLARAHAALMTVVYGELEVDDDNPEFIAAMEEAERDWEEGRTIPHEVVERKLRRSLGHA